VTRRALIAGAAALSAVAPVAAQAPAGAYQSLIAATPDGQPFSDQLVMEAARALAKRPFVSPQTALPDPFQNLNQEQFQAIRARPERHAWTGENRGFVLEPLHRGFIYQAPVALHLVEDGVTRRLVYDSGRFAFGRLQPPGGLPDIGFSGFRLHVEAEGGPREVAAFQGGTFFRSAARGQVHGALARALAIRTADTRGEEFPAFRAFWIERPHGRDLAVVHAVADSESAVAYFRFSLRPGDVTILDTEATVFARAAVDHVGIAPMQATFLFAANRRRNVDDYRPAVHEASGLQILNGRSEWIWRPLNNPESLQISSFMDENPRGFGLVQRDRDFAQYQDDDQRYDLRPSLWIEPIGDWGPGVVQLVEIPTDAEIHDNIIAYWRPRQPMPAGGEIAHAYRQFWCWQPPERPPLALAQGFRTGRGGGRRRHFLIEFTDAMFGSETPPDVRPLVSAPPGTIHNLRLLFNAGRKSARVHFDLEPGGETGIELRLQLLAGDRPVSETWLYRWTA
jgi:glucans biosynthesis protein